MSDHARALFALALELSRASPTHRSPAVSQRTLPKGLDELLRTLNKPLDHPHWSALAAMLGDDPATLRRAGFSLVHRLLCAPGADPYRVLGLAPTADRARVRERYRLLMALFHPDRGRHGDDSQEALCATRINEAYATLKQAPSPASPGDFGGGRTRAGDACSAPPQRAGGESPGHRSGGTDGVQRKCTGTGSTPRRGASCRPQRRGMDPRTVHRSAERAWEGRPGAGEGADLRWWVRGSVLLLLVVAGTLGFWVHSRLQARAERAAATESVPAVPGPRRGIPGAPLSQPPGTEPVARPGP